MDRGSTLQCFLTGLGTGVALTLLFAPHSGIATRRLISRRAKEGEEWVKDKAAVAKDYVETQGAGLREGVKAAAEGLGQG